MQPYKHWVVFEIPIILFNTYDSNNHHGDDHTPSSPFPEAEQFTFF